MSRDEEDAVLVEAVNAAQGVLEWQLGYFRDVYL